MNKIDNPIRIESIFFLRFLAVMLIVIHHLPALLPRDPGDLPLFPVTFFFVLSGFLITLNYRPFTKRKNPLHFFWNRIASIYPLHLMMFFGCLALYYLRNRPINIPAAIANIFLAQSYFSSREFYFSFNSVSWFLSSLFLCYLIFACIMYKPRTSFCIALGLSVSSLVCSIMYIEYNEHPTFSLIQWLLYVFPPNRLLNFLCGMGAAVLFLRLYTRLKSGIGLIFATLLEAVSLLVVYDAIFTKTILHFFVDSVLLAAPFLRETAFHFINNYLIGAFSAVLVVFIFGLENGLISKIFSMRCFVFFGEISFSIFIFHQLFFKFLRSWRHFFLDNYGELFIAFSVCILVIPLSFVIHRFMEIPLRRKLGKVARKSAEG